jgi:hypothetical protein
VDIVYLIIRICFLKKPTKAFDLVKLLMQPTTVYQHLVEQLCEHRLLCMPIIILNLNLICKIIYIFIYTSCLVSKISPSVGFCFLALTRLKKASSKLAGTLTLLKSTLVLVAIT